MEDSNEFIEIETEINKTNCNEFKYVEDNLLQDIDRSKFFQIMEKYFGYSYQTISMFILGRSYTSNDQHEFNIALRKLKKYYNINIIDSILFLENSSIMLNNILKFIDDETKWILKEELSSKYDIVDDVNNIIDIIS